MAHEPVYFVHITDTHIGPSAGFARHGHLSLPSAQRMVDLINAMPTTPDFVVHTGDVVSFPDPDAYALAAETLNEIEPPVYYVVGNHDTAVDIKQYMKMGPRTDCQPDEDVLSYAFEVKGVRFLVIDARAPDELDPHGLLSEAQLELVRREATPDGPPLVVFGHFPALPLDSPWMDAKMPILNGEALHEALLPARDRLRGVFYGHIHHARQTVRDGIVYTATASTINQFTSWPTDEKVTVDADGAPGFSFVHVLPEQTIVEHRTFARPA